MAAKRDYLLTELENGWLVESSPMTFHGPDEPRLAKTYAGVIDDALDIVKKHVKATSKGR